MLAISRQETPKDFCNYEKVNCCQERLVAKIPLRNSPRGTTMFRKVSFSFREINVQRSDPHFCIQIAISMFAVKWEKNMKQPETFQLKQIRGKTWLSCLVPNNLLSLNSPASSCSNLFSLRQLILRGCRSHYRAAKSVEVSLLSQNALLFSREALNISSMI